MVVTFQKLLLDFHGHVTYDVMFDKQGIVFSIIMRCTSGRVPEV